MNGYPIQNDWSVNITAGDPQNGWADTKFTTKEKKLEHFCKHMAAYLYYGKSIDSTTTETKKLSNISNSNIDTLVDDNDLFALAKSLGFDSILDAVKDYNGKIMDHYKNTFNGEAYSDLDWDALVALKLVYGDVKTPRLEGITEKITIADYWSGRIQTAITNGSTVSFASNNWSEWRYQGKSDGETIEEWANGVGIDWDYFDDLTAQVNFKDDRMGTSELEELRDEINEYISPMKSDKDVLIYGDASSSYSTNKNTIINMSSSFWFHAYQKSTAYDISLAKLEDINEKIEIANYWYGMINDKYSDGNNVNFAENNWANWRYEGKADGQTIKEWATSDGVDMNWDSIENGTDNTMNKSELQVFLAEIQNYIDLMESDSDMVSVDLNDSLTKYNTALEYISSLLDKMISMLESIYKNF